MRAIHQFLPTLDPGDAVGRENLLFRERAFWLFLTGHRMGDLRRLISQADVLLCNLLPSRQQRYGLDPESLFAVKPNLVHATLTGYGLNGPDASRPGRSGGIGGERSPNRAPRCPISGDFHVCSALPTISVPTPTL